MNSWLIHTGLQGFEAPLLDTAVQHIGFDSRSENKEAERRREICKQNARRKGSPLMNSITKMYHEGLSKEQIIDQSGASEGYVTYVLRIIRSKVSPGNGKSLSAPVVQYDLQGNKIKEYANAYEAAEAMELSAKHIRNVCIPGYRQKTAGGFIFRYKGE